MSRSKARAVRSSVQSVDDSGVLKPMPGRLGMTRWKASSARPSCAVGSVSGPMTSRKSANEPG